jgi:hypothetical protein
LADAILNWLTSEKLRPLLVGSRVLVRLLIAGDPRVMASVATDGVS